MEWRCESCGRLHVGLPFAYSQQYPTPYAAIPLAERESRAAIGDEDCVIDGEQFFLRARVLLPVIDGPEPTFEWGVWVSLSKANFLRALGLWNTSGRESEPDCFCYVCSVLPTYPSTYLLKGRLHTRPVGERPVVELEPTDHPLAVEQRTGITMAHVRDIAEQALHQ